MWKLMEIEKLLFWRRKAKASQSWHPVTTIQPVITEDGSPASGHLMAMKIAGTTHYRKETAEEDAEHFADDAW